MPWHTRDEARSHAAALTDPQADVWLRVANTALARCLDTGGSTDRCEASAIRQANAVAPRAGKQVADGASDAPGLDAMLALLGTPGSLLERKTAPALATPTDLPAADLPALITALNGLAADAVALWLKTKNYHWHVTGPLFHDYHRLFDVQAEAIYGTIDVLAERVRKLGGATLHSIAEVQRRATITDSDEERLPAAEMTARLLADNQAQAVAQRRTARLADGLGDYATANILQGFIDATEHRIWTLYALQQPAS